MAIIKFKVTKTLPIILITTILFPFHIIENWKLKTCQHLKFQVNIAIWILVFSDRIKNFNKAGIITFCSYALLSINSHIMHVIIELETSIRSILNAYLSKRRDFFESVHLILFFSYKKDIASKKNIFQAPRFTITTICWINSIFCVKVYIHGTFHRFKSSSAQNKEDMKSCYDYFHRILQFILSRQEIWLPRTTKVLRIPLYTCRLWDKRNTRRLLNR